MTVRVVQFRSLSRAGIDRHRVANGRPAPLPATASSPTAPCRQRTSGRHAERDPNRKGLSYNARARQTSLRSLSSSAQPEHDARAPSFSLRAPKYRAYAPVEGEKMPMCHDSRPRKRGRPTPKSLRSLANRSHRADNEVARQGTFDNIRRNSPQFQRLNIPHNPKIA